MPLKDEVNFTELGKSQQVPDEKEETTKRETNFNQVKSHYAKSSVFNLTN
jgi:hypothetical protein